MEKTGTGRDGMPLRAEVVGDGLIISIGIETLAFAFHNGEANNPYDSSTGDFTQAVKIADSLVFAQDVCRHMNDEGEDGSTPLTRFLDSMMEQAVEQGSMGIFGPED